MTHPRDHWEAVYRSKPPEGVSWYQPHAWRSMDFIRATGLGPGARIIDVGGGASTLVDDLLAGGWRDVTVLDLSSAALAVAQQRLGDAARGVTWIAGDACHAPLPDAAFDIWHDRAVFHFLTDAADRAAYLRQVMRCVRPGGHVIVATFAPDGPTQCSGLPVARYAPDELHREFGPAFTLLEHADEQHHTPWGAVQHFVYCHCVKPH